MAPSHDRVFGTEPVTVAAVDAMVTGIQNRDGSTVSGVALRVEGIVIGDGRPGAVTADLTPGQALDLAAALRLLANRAQELDHLV